MPRNLTTFIRKKLCSLIETLNNSEYILLTHQFKCSLYIKCCPRPGSSTKQHVKTCNTCKFIYTNDNIKMISHIKMEIN